MSDNIKLTESDKNFTNLLTVLFIGLKLGDVIDWSWWFVLSPIWITMLIVFAYTIFQKN